MKDMKSLFPGYYRKSDSQIGEIWSKCLIAFDTNVFIDLYDYSVETRDALLELMEQLKEKIWMPYHVALEYNRRRNDVISNQINTLQGLQKDISKITELIENKDKQPHISSKLKEKLKKCFEELDVEIDQNKSSLKQTLRVDPIYERVNGIFSNKISDAFEEQKLTDIYAKGKGRYKDKIPPGYMDQNKANGNEYGDYVIWCHIIEKAKTTKLPIIFVTNERKEDWWCIVNGDKISPRQELVAEIFKEANVDFYLYSSSNFLRFGQEYLNKTANTKAVEEIERFEKKYEFEKFIDELLQRLLQNNILIQSLSERLNEVDNEIEDIKKTKFPGLSEISILFEEESADVVQYKKLLEQQLDLQHHIFALEDNSRKIEQNINYKIKNETPGIV